MPLASIVTDDQIKTAERLYWRHYSALAKFTSELSSYVSYKVDALHMLSDSQDPEERFKPLTKAARNLTVLEQDAITLIIEVIASQVDHFQAGRTIKTILMEELLKVSSFDELAAADRAMADDNCEEFLNAYTRIVVEAKDLESIPAKGINLADELFDRCFSSSGALDEIRQGRLPEQQQRKVRLG